MGTTGYSDTFNRTVSNGLGTATSGQVYTLSSTATQYNVAASTATILPSVGGDLTGTVDNQTQDADISGRVALSAIPATNSAQVGLVAKWASSNNYYFANMLVLAGGAISIRLSSRISGVGGTVKTVATGLTYVANTFYNMRFQVYWSAPLQTNILSAKLWLTGTTEPTGWTVTGTDAGLDPYFSGTQVGIMGRDDSTVLGTITTKYRSVSTVSYDLPMPDVADPMCAAPGASSTGFCSIAVADGGFESGDPAADGWRVEGGTLAADNAIVHSGTWSALVTAVGSPGQLILRNASVVAVSPGGLVNAQMWVWSPVDATILAVIDYYAAANAYLSSDSVSYSVRANTWTQLVSRGAGAPATTVRVEYGPTIFGPSNGTIMRADDLDIQGPCTTTALTYPPETALQLLAEASDTAMASLDPLTSLAALFPRVRISTSNLVINTATFSSLTYSTTEFNVGTNTDLGYDNTALYLPTGVWLVTYEIRLAEAASNYIQISVFGTVPSVSQVFVDMRSNAAQSNDQSVGGCGHISVLTYSTDPTTPIQVAVSFLANNTATTYTVQYMALSAIKISDYFA
jgi:hypothetical protein